MAAVLIFHGLMGCLIMGVAADSTISLCPGQDCGYCPAKITTDGTGYPSCVIYDRDTVLGSYADDYGKIDAQDKTIYFDIAAQTSLDCRTIVRSPAETDDVNCGTAIISTSAAMCIVAKVKPSFMVQFCCGTGDCNNAGVKKRDGNSGRMSSAVLKDTFGNILVPHAVGDSAVDKLDVFLEDYGLNASSVLGTRSASDVPLYKVGYARDNDLQKRDCDAYKADRDGYSRTGDVSTQLSGYICDSTTEVTFTNEQSVAHTTTFSTSVGDPFGIVSTSIGFETETEASQSYMYSYTPVDGDCGHLSWTPFFECTSGTITGCEGGDQTGEVCTAKRISDNQIDGAYTFVQSG